MTLHKKSIGLVAVMLLILVAHPFPAAARRDDRVNLQVFAAASLAEAFGAIGKRFEATHPGVRVRFNFAGSQVLVRQIEQGAGADVIATADERTMSRLTDHARLANPPVTFARNRIVVVVPRGNPARIAHFADLARAGVKIVIAAETVPAGSYARQVIANLARAPGFAADFERRVLANVVSQEENVRAVVGKVQLGEADAGWAYRSDVGSATTRFVRVLEIDPQWNVMAAYPIAIVKDAHAPDAAREFVALVRSAEGQAFLRRHGFLSADAGH
jgi:molybdate transport system substrate-binding protein